MSIEGQSLFRVSSLTREAVEGVFEKAGEFADTEFQCLHGFSKHSQSKVVALLFFEPSTRTRFSFETALHRIGHKFISLDSAGSTSMSKGESLVETVETILAMGVDALIVRSGNNPEFHQYLEKLSLPVINAGSGIDEHPTQALLDAFTLRQEFGGNLAGRKIVFVGDVAHSRVANSNRVLLELLGCEVAYCCPEYFEPGESWKNCRSFRDIAKACEWADALVGLRVQKERHEASFQDEKHEFYVENYCINHRNIKSLPKSSIIMHPGPFVPGEDLNLEVLEDSRCRIRQQVRNGVYVRAALFKEILGVGKI